VVPYRWERALLAFDLVLVDLPAADRVEECE
jgi:hypothetical protein